MTSKIYLSSVQIQPEAKVYWGAYVQGVPWDAGKLESFEANAGKQLSIIHWGQPWWHAGKYQSFTPGVFDIVRKHGSIPMIDWNSWDYAVRPQSVQPAFSLQTIIAGKHDSYIQSWAEQAKKWGHPFFLSFNHEMNGWWYPWSEQVNGNRDGEFVQAWRHVHDIFERVGATNVTWVWAPNIDGPRSTSLDTLYPGDQYVDWTSMHGYNWSTDQGNPWMSFKEIFQETYDHLLRIAPTKPIMIGEVATSEDGGPSGRPGSKAEWIRDALAIQLPSEFPQIKALVWFNWNDDNPKLEWPVETSRQAINSFATAIGSNYYASNDFGSLQSGRIAPLP